MQQEKYTPMKTPETGKLITDDNGNRMKVADMQTLEAALKKAYPDGIVIKMQDESLSHLMDISEAVETGEEYLLDDVTFAGQIDEQNPHIVPPGILKAELRIPPEMIDRIYPNEMEYPLDAPEAEWMEWQDRAATRFLHDHADHFRGAEVEVTIREEIMPLLYIEGHPFPEVKSTIDRIGIISDQELRQVLNLQHLHRNGIPEDVRIPDCLKELLQPVTDKYKLLPDTPDNRKSQQTELANKVEQLLKTCRALPTDRHNLVAVFDSRDAALQAVTGINSRFAPLTAMAVRNDRTVEVSILSFSPLEQMNVKQLLNLPPESQGVEVKPYRNLNIAHTAYVYCANGQILTGYKGVEGLNSEYIYGLQAKQTDKGIQWQLREQVDPEHPEMSFSTNEKVNRFRRDFKGGYMPLPYVAELPVFERLQTFHNYDIHFTQDNQGVIESILLCGKVDGFDYREIPLDKDDLALVRRTASESRQWPLKLYDAIKIFADKYFDDQLTVAWQKEKTARDVREKMTDETKQLLDRVTDAKLYGKVDNIHVRCKIDGVQQMGRPIPEQDAEPYIDWKETAKAMGKDRLNYKNWLHEDSIKQIAVQVYSDVLSQECSQARDRSISR